VMEEIADAGKINKTYGQPVFLKTGLL